MLFFWWNKYETSWLATLISMIGTIIVTLGSIILFIAICEIFDGVKLISIIGGIIGIVVFFFLKFLLNKLTDKIDIWHCRVSVNISNKIDDRKNSKLKTLINEGKDQRELYKMIKKEYVSDIDLVIEGIGKLTDQSLIRDLIKYNDNVNRNFSNGQIIRSELYINYLNALINQINDEDEQNKLREYYRI